METDNSTNVKFSTVLSFVKMNGDTNTAQNLKISTVLAHTLLLPVMVLGLVKISMEFLLKLLLIMIPMVMVKSILVMILIQNT